MTVLGVGSRLYLPVLAAGALAYVGDPHFSQGDGEVALTAFEASLRATLRFTVLERSNDSRALAAVVPFAETPTHWHPLGLHRDLNEAMRDCVRRSLALLEMRYGVDPTQGLAYLSATTDFGITQVVEQVHGVYSKIRKADLEGL
jgi:acetamidase/formamidase